MGFILNKDFQNCNCLCGNKQKLAKSLILDENENENHKIKSSIHHSCREIKESAYKCDDQQIDENDTNAINLEIENGQT